MRKYLFLFIAIASIYALFLGKSQKTNLAADIRSTQKETPKYHAMVVSAHPLASEVGTAILKKGGNAVDAAIAVHYALSVVFPVAGNIGGGGFFVIREKDGTSHALDFREMAPSAAYKDMYLDKKGEPIKDLSFFGHKAVGVPGAVAGMFAAHKKLGKLPMAELIQPAIDLAEKGFLLTNKEANSWNNSLPKMKEHSTKSNVFTGKMRWAKGDSVCMYDLAETLKRIRDYGQAGFYEGKTADLIVEEMKRGGGIITHEDLKNYKAVWRTPIKGSYKGHEIISMPPPSSGGIALLQLLGMVEDYEIPKNSWHEPATTHLMVEAERRVYADRAAHLGDPDFWKVPVAGLLDRKYIRSRMTNFNPKLATKSSQIKAGVPPIKEHEETTHFSIIDSEGNAVSCTTTLNGAYGSMVVVGGAGFFLNNEMDDFSIKPGVANYYGLVGAEANKVEAGKRMLSSMTPTIVVKDGKLRMVVGTPGGSTIITSVFQVILNVLEHGKTMQEAVAASRFHSQWLPDKISHEKGAFTSKQMEALKALGHTLDERSAIGRVDAILVNADGSLSGGADPRGDDSAKGLE